MTIAIRMQPHEWTAILRAVETVLSNHEQDSGCDGVNSDGCGRQGARRRKEGAVMSDSGREMTRTEMMVRISELAAERDAAIDARLTIERERDGERARADAALRVVVDTTKELVAAEFARDNARGTCKILGQSLDEARRQEAMEALDDAGVPCAIGATLPSRVQWLAAQNRQLATAVAAATNGDAFVLTRTAWHLANGCDTVSRAAAEARRELAVVLGGGS